MVSLKVKFVALFCAAIAAGTMSPADAEASLNLFGCNKGCSPAPVACVPTCPPQRTVVKKYRVVKIRFKVPKKAAVRVVAPIQICPPVAMPCCPPVMVPCCPPVMVPCCPPVMVPCCPQACAPINPCPPVASCCN